MKIGADEIILWLRKNNIAKSFSNDQLGKKIREIIESLGGTIEEYDVKSRWSDSENVDRYNLPKTSAQYEIQSDKLPELYEKLGKIE
jgi:hypothetical protein